MTTTLSPFPAHQAPPAAEELRYFVDELRKMHSAFLILVRDAEDNDGWLGRDLAEEWQLRFDDLIGSNAMKWLDRGV